MGALIEVVLPVFLLIGFGYFATVKRWIASSSIDGLMVFAQKFAIPCLLFGAISRLDLGQTFDVKMLASFYTGAIACFFLGLFGSRLLFGRPWEDCVAIGFCGLFSNSALLGLPISERAYGAESLATNFAIIAIHSPICYFLGITAMEMVNNRGGGGMQTVKAVLKAMFSNAMILGLVAGFIVNLGHLPVPSVIFESTDMLARAALPAALFGLGGVLTRYRPEGDTGPVVLVVILSLVLHPLIAYGMLKSFGIDHTVLRSAVLTASMAPGVNTYVFADMYGKARRVAATSVLVATAASVISVWVWLQVLG